MKLASGLRELRYEAQVLGMWPFCVPLLVAGGLGGLATLLDLHGVNAGFLAQLLTATLEACLPLALGVLVATLVARDSALELQLTLLTPYRGTTAKRIAILFVWTALIATVTMLAIQSAVPQSLPVQGAASVLIWLAPLLWLTAVGALLALMLHSGATAAAALGVLWVAQLALHGYFVASGWTLPWFLFATLAAPQDALWGTNRVELILTAAGVFLVLWFYLRNAEWRFRAEEG